MTDESVGSTLIVDAVTFKVLVVGAFGIGKTSLIQQISQVPVIGTEVATSGDEALVKPTTTVGVEYGLYSVGDGDATVTLLLFGTPGQDRFSVARDVASSGADGLIVIVDGTAESTWETGRLLHDSYNPDRSLPTLLIINRWPADSAPPAGLPEAIGVESDSSMISAGDVIDPTDARRFVVELLTVILRDEAEEEFIG